VRVSSSSKQLHFSPNLLISHSFFPSLLLQDHHSTKTNFKVAVIDQNSSGNCKSARQKPCDDDDDDEARGEHLLLSSRSFGFAFLPVVIFSGCPCIAKNLQ
jgi:hypothetical protein